MRRSIATNSCHCQQLKRVLTQSNLQPMVANTKNDFAERLNQACDAANPPIPMGRGRRAELRRRVLSHGLDVSGESVRKWLSGESIPSMDSLRFIATALAVESEWLLTGRDASNRVSSPQYSVQEKESPVYEIYSSQIRDVISIMQTLDASHQAKVLFAAQLAKHEYDSECSRNSPQRVGS